eukprot:3856230-Amphidinium_carterae.1
MHLRVFSQRRAGIERADRQAAKIFVTESCWAMLVKVQDACAHSDMSFKNGDPTHQSKQYLLLRG